MFIYFFLSFFQIACFNLKKQELKNLVFCLILSILFSKMTRSMKSLSLLDLVERARSWAVSEIQQYGVPALEHLEISNAAGKKLAKIYNADENLVLIGTLLMDIKLGWCVKNQEVSKHVEISHSHVSEFLSHFDLPSFQKEIILNSVISHHDISLCTSKESEIVANADCYRFLTPRGFLTAFNIFSKRFNTMEEALDAIQAKANEKLKILSLPEAKEELEPYYLSFNTLFFKS